MKSSAEDRSLKASDQQYGFLARRRLGQLATGWPARDTRPLVRVVDGTLLMWQADAAMFGEDIMALMSADLVEYASPWEEQEVQRLIAVFDDQRVYDDVIEEVRFRRDNISLASFAEWIAEQYLNTLAAHSSKCAAWWEGYFAREEPTTNMLKAAAMSHFMRTGTHMALGIKETTESADMPDDEDCDYHCACASTNRIICAIYAVAFLISVWILAANHVILVPLFSGC